MRAWLSMRIPERHELISTSPVDVGPSLAAHTALTPRSAAQTSETSLQAHDIQHHMTETTAYDIKTLHLV